MVIPFLQYLRRDVTDIDRLGWTLNLSKITIIVLIK